MALSKSIHVGSGVRQGGVLSPSLFNIIMNLRVLYFLGCAMYADDLIIISASQSGLQAMLDVCVSSCENLFFSLKYNILVENVIRNLMILCYVTRRYVGRVPLIT